MRNRLIAMAALAGLASPGAAGAGVRPRLTAVVRVYDSYGVARSEVEAARARLGWIFAAAGIVIAWVDCPADAADTGPCGAPVAADELVVRFLHSGESTRGETFAMGDTLVGGDITAGSLMTVYPDRVERAAGAGGARGALLGLVIAHEIGHQLLGPNAHSRNGLMRPLWSRDEIAHGSLVDWRFSPREVSRMRERLTARRAE